MLGASLPDAPVTLVGLALALTSGDGAPFITRMSALYFHEPWLIALHNTLHAPLMAGALVVMGWAWWRCGGAGRVLAFGGGALSHSLIDLATHHDDGPLVLFPFDWALRFESPLSHWDVSHYALWVTAVEGFIVGVAVALWLAGRVRSRGPGALEHRQLQSTPR